MNKNFLKLRPFLILATIIILGVLAWIYYSEKSPTSTSNMSTTQNTSNNTQDTNSANIDNSKPGTATNELLNNSALAISTQISGNSVNIDNFYLEKPGFIVISSSTADGKPGSIIAQSSWLNSGSGQDLEFPVKLQAGRTYFASLYLDSNNNKKFDPTNNLDKPVAQDGKTLYYKFNVSN